MGSGCVLMVFRLLLPCLLVASPFFVESVSSRKDGVSALEDFLREAESRGVIDAAQVLKLQELAEDVGLATAKDLLEPEGKLLNVEDEVKNDDERRSTFMRIYSHFTLLNVLYLSGAVITMGAYSLFMTLAIEKMHYGLMSVVMSVQMVAMGIAGIKAWETVEYSYVGGILCTICTSMVPFTMYNLLRTLQIWPGKDPGNFIGFHVYIRPGWVVMEVATIAVGVGFVFLTGVYFPFLLFPVSFALWYLSMDLSPLVPGWNSILDHYTIRARVSLLVGVATMLAGYVFERMLGSDPDMGFWLYLFGMLTFKLAISFDFPSWDVKGSLYLLTQAAMILIGSHLDRTTFHVFGVIGMVEYVFSICSHQTSLSSSTLLWLLKALLAAALFSQAIRRDGNIEVLAGLVCLVGFNFNFLHFLTSNELYQLLFLATNLGFVTVPQLLSRPLDLWLFTIPDVKVIISFATCVSVALYHLKVAKHLYSLPENFSGHLFLGYRILMSVLVSVAFVFLRQPYFSWVGGAGAFAAGACYITNKKIPKPVGAVMVVIAVLYSLFMQSNLMYLVACLALLVVLVWHLEKEKAQGCVIAVLLILLSVPLSSKFLIAIGAIYVISYLTHLAYATFRNSLIFPLVLVAMGLLIIASAVKYQSVESQIQEAFYSAIPDSVKTLLSSNIHMFWKEGGATDWYPPFSQTRFTLDSLVEHPLKWLLWSGAFTHALVHGRPMYVSYLLAVCIEALATVAIFLYFRQKMIKNVDGHVLVEEMEFKLSDAPEHKGHGLVINIKGNRSAFVEEPVHMALDVPTSSYSYSFWPAAERAFGSFPVSMGRSMFLPYRLTPHLISVNWNVGKSIGNSNAVRFSAVIQLGTGHKGSQRMKHETAVNAVKKLLGTRSDIQMVCVVMYKQAWYQPWSKLCAKTVNMEDINQAISPAHHKRR